MCLPVPYKSRSSSLPCHESKGSSRALFPISLIGPRLLTSCPAFDYCLSSCCPFSLGCWAGSGETQPTKLVRPLPVLRSEKCPPFTVSIMRGGITEFNSVDRGSASIPEPRGPRPTNSVPICMQRSVLVVIWRLPTGSEIPSQLAVSNDLPRTRQTLIVGACAVAHSPTPA